MRGLLALFALLVAGLIVAPDATRAIIEAGSEAAARAWPHIVTLLNELAAACGRLIAGVIGLAQSGHVPASP